MQNSLRFQIVVFFSFRKNVQRWNPALCDVTEGTIPIGTSTMQPPSFFLFSNMRKLKKKKKYWVKAFSAGGCKPKAVDAVLWIICWCHSWPIEELKIGGVVWGKLVGPQRCKTKAWHPETLLMRFHIREAGPVSHSTHTGILFYTQPHQPHLEMIFHVSRLTDSEKPDWLCLSLFSRWGDSRPVRLPACDRPLCQRVQGVSQ